MRNLYSYLCIYLYMSTYMHVCKNSLSTSMVAAWIATAMEFLIVSLLPYHHHHHHHQSSPLSTLPRRRRPPKKIDTRESLMTCCMTICQTSKYFMCTLRAILLLIFLSSSNRVREDIYILEGVRALVVNIGVTWYVCVIFIEHG